MAFDTGSTPAAEHTGVLVIGTGFAGLGMGIKLKEAGMGDFVLLERAQSVGGTWRDNHYPGCACDVPSHLYSFSFELSPRWSRMFAVQPEIRAYLEGCARKYGLLPHVRFGAELVRAEYDETAQLWRVRTRDGRQFTAPVLISGMGGLSNPAYPQLPGLERFQGPAFHSAEWRHDVDLRGKRVAVIGTGASAIQFVPQIAPLAAQLDLYQRTPPWIMPKPDRTISRFEQKLFQYLPWVQRLWRGLIYWMLEARALGFVVHPRLMKGVQWIANRHIRKQVQDPALRAKLTPDYTIGCKRILISNDYYPALTRPNVAVLTQAISEVRAHGVVTADGVEHPADVLIYGTGFKAQEPVPRGMLFGRDGVDLHEAWAQGVEAYLGTTVSGFPNFFMIVGPNTGLGHSSMVYMIESQVHYILQALKLLRDRGLGALDVKPEVQAQFNQGLQARLGRTIWTAGCKSWYLDRNGKNTTLWPGFTFHFRKATRKFRLDDYRLSPQTERASTATVP
jgi:cation diffusion facilitator CzcD-associated flavoprotein CzcO